MNYVDIGFVGIVEVNLLREYLKQLKILLVYKIIVVVWNSGMLAFFWAIPAHKGQDQ